MTVTAPYRSTALLGFFMLVVAGCAPLSDSVYRAAGAGLHSEGGIGGTGSYATGPDPEEGGVGGTGLFGTITGIGSIDLNGRRIDIPDGLVVESLLDVGSIAALDVGQAVAVEVATDANALRAMRIVRIFALVGPVESLDATRLRLTVMGTAVDASRLVVGMPEGIGIGDTVAVSGIWHGGIVVAARVDRSSGRTASATGLMRRTGAGWRIGATAVGLECCPDPVTDGFGGVAGAYRDGRLQASRIVIGSESLFGTRTRRLVVEAFLAPDPDGVGFHLSGFGIPMDPRSALGTVVDRRSLFSGRYDGRFLIQRSNVLPDDPDARRSALDRLEED